MTFSMLYSRFFKTILSAKEPVLIAHRFASRKGKRAALRLLKKQEKKKNAKTEVVAKWVSPNLRVAREILSVRKRVNEEGLKPLPAIDDVWVMSDHVQQVFPLKEAVDMHRETHHPEMLNLPTALIHATVELDIRLLKKNRYMENIFGTLRYPNLFKMSSNPRKILALCKAQDGQEAAAAAGAELVGSVDLIKRLQSGDLKVENFNHLVAHMDILQDLTTVRGLLKRHFPTPAKGNLGLDMASMVDRFQYGLDYSSQKDTLELDFGWVDAAFGTLDMKDAHLEDNLSSLLREVEKSRPKGVERAFVTRLLVWSPPSQEKFLVPFWEYLEGYQDPRLVKKETAEEEEAEDQEEKVDSV